MSGLDAKCAFAPKRSEFCSFLHFCARICSLAQNDLPNHQYSCSHSYVFACCARRCQKGYSPQFSVFLAASCIFVNISTNFSKNTIFFSFRGPEAIWARKTKGLERTRRDVFHKFDKIWKILNSMAEIILRRFHQCNLDFLEISGFYVIGHQKGMLFRYVYKVLRAVAFG